jgi:cytochrome c553
MAHPSRTRTRSIPPMKNLAILLGLALASVATVAYAADAAENWATHCASCHGKDGVGATKAGRTAGVKDLTDAEYQKSFTDAKAAEQIKAGMKDPKDPAKEKMKAFGEKLTDAEIAALVAHLRTFKK